MSEATDTAAISFSCAHCALELTVPIALAGVSGPCPSCGGTIVSPTPAQMAPAAMAPAAMAPAAMAPAAVAPAAVAPAAMAPAPVAQVEVVPGPNAVASARPLAPKPRPMRARSGAAELEEPEGPLMQAAPRQHKVMARTRNRSIHPVAGLSTRYDEQRERGAVVRVAIAFLLTLIVVAIVFSISKGR